MMMRVLNIDNTKAEKFAIVICEKNDARAGRCRVTGRVKLEGPEGKSKRIRDVPSYNILNVGVLSHCTRRG